MSTTSKIADALEKSGIPFTRVEGVANGIEYWGLSVRHENVHAEVRECSDWVEMKAWNYTPEQFMNMLVGAGTCRNKGFVDDGGWYFVCSKCGCEFEYGDFACEFAEGHGLGSPKFCPNCGKKVVGGR